MEILYLLIPLSLLLLGLAVYAFFWAVKHHQFQNMDTHARQILEPDHPLPEGEGLKEPAALNLNHQKEPARQGRHSR